MKTTIITIIIIFTLHLSSYSQHNGHEHHNSNTDSTEHKTDTIKTEDKEMHNHNDHQDESKDSLHHNVDSNKTKGMETMDHNMHMPSMSMNHIYSLNLPMSRNGSGTGWMPDATPMFGYMAHSGSWMFMFHGSIFLRYNSQDITKEGSRGASKFDAPNWFMVMGQSKVGSSGLFGFSSMFSLDPITVGGEGYPLLFQSGETWEGKPLVDRQHPHNFFSELSLGYTQSFSKKTDLNIYLGYPGEPALGPVAFMHRLSSSYNPDSPLGHHWQDATHITFGVATLGFRYDKVKVEGSIFTGREPSEKRYGFDEPKFDSYSFRVNFNPTKELATQVSYGFVKSPESSHPNEDVKKTTASVIHSKKFLGNSFLASSIVFGMNDAGGDHKENSLLLESAYSFNKNAVYGRFEWVQKSGEELLIEGAHDEIYNINALTLGYNRELYKFSNTIISAGVQGSVFFPDKELEQIYGKMPLSAEVYLRFSPGMEH